MRWWWNELHFFGALYRHVALKILKHNLISRISIILLGRVRLLHHQLDSFPLIFQWKLTSAFAASSFGGTARGCLLDTGNDRRTISWPVTGEDCVGGKKRENNSFAGLLLTYYRSHPLPWVCHTIRTTDEGRTGA